MDITASSRGQGSVSRLLSSCFIKALQDQQDDLQVTHHNVGLSPPGHNSEALIDATFTPLADRSDAMNDLLAPSEVLIDEFLAADCLVIATPMFNFGLPAALKAYIDAIVRNGRTFSIDPETHQFKGLATNKKAVIIVSSGQDYSAGSGMADKDFLVPYLRCILNFMGVEDITVVRAPNQAMPSPVNDQAVSKAREELVLLAAQWG